MNKPKMEELNFMIPQNQKYNFEGYPPWYSAEIAKDQPIDISKFDGNLEEAVTFYYKEVNKLFFANSVLTTQLKAALEEKKQLADQIAHLQKQEKNSNEEKRRRHRRCANEIERRYICPVKKCEKSYGTEGSMAQHMRLKHPEMEYTLQMCEGNQRSEDGVKIKQEEMVRVVDEEESE